VLADPGQIHQILMNLAVNARDAMPEGGKLIIETSNAEIDDSYVDTHADTSAGPHVLLAVTDTGVGMDEGTLSHAFEPFFTTKLKGQGTGLGLSTVYGIVKQNGGWVWAYSEVGKGTVFKIYLPRIQSAVEAPNSVKPLSDVLTGAECILIVEDQAEVRKLAADVLKRFGYRVLEAANGNEALVLCERFDGQIHLMVTDVVMPGMNGRELANRMRALRPDIKVLYVSGYTANAIVEEGVIEPEIEYLSKPFSPSALGRRVREILG
jgi:CheY-like chemotaxis protein